ncbi:MAG: FHA domain-containing protein [Candidatus Acidiferrales bacterium]
MGVILEIKAGPFAGKKVAVVSGQTVTFGRAEGRAEFALPHDTFMSGVHFAVECGPQGCRVIDKKSSNGTLLNGARIADAMLANGDEIKGGQTTFAVKIVPDAKLAALAEPQKPQASHEIVSSLPAVPIAARPVEEAKPASLKPASIQVAPQPSPFSRANIAEPQPPAPAVSPADQSREAGSVRRTAPADATPPFVAQRSVPPVAVPAAAIPKPGVPPDARAGAKLPAPAFSVMGWSFSAIPEKWQIQQEFGLQRNAEGEFPSSVAASQEALGGISLQQFVESQISMLRGYLRDPRIEPTMPPRVSGAEESMAVDVRHSTKDGKELVYRRIYARSGSSVGVLTVTTLAADLPQVLQSLQPLLDGAAFRSTVNN